MDKTFSWLSVASAMLRMLSALLEYWQAALVGALVLSPAGPHVLWSYSYTGSAQHKRYTHCTYLGSRGFITPNIAPDCPLLAFLDARDWRR